MRWMRSKWSCCVSVYFDCSVPVRRQCLCSGRVETHPNISFQQRIKAFSFHVGNDLRHYTLHSSSMDAT